ncbi:hypothetical protein GEU84_002725 [Fertoebacter nigrum]|uniref:Uncharacterized protein n=1 Tax=Fertoeibacter niger TaxID=2656921 RepID=A0A8X8GY18_9RHOB|nr:hypothetical protein [Fertoeibacter niger]NUB43285.1 hypothetical protein [Fertoeibacter niger]
MARYRCGSLLAGAVLAAVLAAGGPGLAATDGQRITVTGEFIDTWCYFSGVMGGTDAVVGSAHHTCAMWCSAGGIPVGLLAEDGQIYMVLKVEGDDANAGGDTLLTLASDTITADGIAYSRDGLNYIVVEKVVSNAGIVNQNHADYGVVPDFAIPEPKK